MTAKEKYQSWLDNPGFDPETHAELTAIASDDKEIEDRFYQDLKFGTAGLRGILGAGTNRMNFYTVARAAEGFARVIAAGGEENKQKGIAISFDSRHFSKEFAQLTARIFRRQGVKVYLSDELRPVPLLSFALRTRGCVAGVMITASHNPKAYNGFKAYGGDGSQLAPEGADKVAAAMDQLTDLPAILQDLPELDPENDPGLVMMGDDLDQDYNNYLLEQIIDKDAIKRHHDMEIIYSPLHGTGFKPVTRALKSLGFTNVSVVPEQAEPNGDFPTAPYPNPEAREAMELGIQLAEKEHADLLIATDPDADRLGVAVRTNDGDFILLSGNEIGCLLMDYILSAKHRLQQDDKQHFCVVSVVSSRLPRRICDRYGVKLYESLTGFKYIAEKIREGMDKGEVFDFGFEESFGYLAGDNVRDKDAVVAAALVCEMAAAARDDNQSLYERLQDLFKTYGYAAEKTVAFTREGKVGLEKIRNAMKVVRTEKKTIFDTLDPKSLVDYQTQEKVDLDNGETTPLDINQSNVLIFNLKDLDWFATRPSGTEPKLKVYMGAYDETPEKAQAKLDTIEAAVVDKIEGELDR